MAGSEMSNGSASSVTDHSPRASLARIARRVGSASAENVASREPSLYLTTRLNIGRRAPDVNAEIHASGVVLVSYAPARLE